MPATKGDEEAQSWRTTSSSCSGSRVEESKRSQSRPQRARYQDLAAAVAHGRGGAPRSLPCVRSGEPPRRGTSWPPRPWPSRAAGAWPGRPERARPSSRAQAAPLPLPALRGGDPRTSEYVRLRLGRADCERDLFTAEALTSLHEVAGSSLREIDRVATAALRESARRKKKLVERDVMARVIGDVKSDAD